MTVFVFEEKDFFFQALHPAVALAWLMVIVIGAVAFCHPLFLLALFIPILTALAASGALGAWYRSARFFFLLIAALAFANMLINRLGSTVLLWGPVFPLLGRVMITLETLVFALVMGIRLLIVFTAFMLCNQAINPDKVLSMAARLFPRSALLVALTSKTIPHLLRKLQSVGEVAQCRGANFHTGSLVARIKNRLPLIRVLFISSLEDSFNIGESIRARAYGSGPRSSYFRHRWRPGDTLVAAASLLSLFTIILSLSRGWGGYTFYPSLEKIIVSVHQVMILPALFLMVMIPALLAWGWNKWNFLRWKI